MTEEHQTIKYFLYARRSREKRDSEEKVVSIESQIKEMTEMAEAKGLEIVKVFSEAKSAKEPYIREQFNLMMKQIGEGKANGVICFAISRLARNSIEEGQIKYFLQKGIIKNIKTPDRDWYPEDNVLLASLDFGMATQYSIDLTKHIKRGLRASCSSGYRPCYAPLGYVNSKYHQKGKQEEILVDEERFFLVRKIFDYVLSDKYSVSELYRIVKEESLLKVRVMNGRPSKMMSLSSFFRLLSNPFYYGEFIYNGNLYQGNHTPMITKDEYYRVQEIIGNVPRRPKEHAFAYTGFIKCGECGGSITAESKTKRHQNGNVHHYTYYHCTKRKHPECTQLCITENELERQVLEHLQKIHIPQEVHGWALDALKKQKKADENDVDKIATVKRKAFADCENKLLALLDMRLANELSPADYAVKKSALEKELSKLKEEVLNIGESAEDWFAKMKDTLEFSKNVLAEYENGDMETRRGILRAVCAKPLLLNKKLVIEIEKPFTNLVEIIKNI